jgi:hypothetical protein
VEVLTKIFMALGTPTDESWAGLRAMPGFVEFQATPAPGLRKTFPSSIVGVRYCLVWPPLAIGVVGVPCPTKEENLWHTGHDRSWLN